MGKFPLTHEAKQAHDSVIKDIKDIIWEEYMPVDNLFPWDEAMTAKTNRILNKKEYSDLSTLVLLCKRINGVLCALPKDTALWNLKKEITSSEIAEFLIARSAVEVPLKEYGLLTEQFLTRFKLLNENQNSYKYLKSILASFHTPIDIDVLAAKHAQDCLVKYDVSYQLRNLMKRHT